MGAIELDRPSGANTRFEVPTYATAGQTIHVIAEATDSGVPALTRYEHFVVTIR